jgi:GAF domain-containing protein
VTSGPLLSEDVLMTVPAEPSAKEFARLARELAELHGVLPTVEGVVHRAVEVVPCDWAAVAVTDHLTRRPARLSAANDADLAAVVADIAGRHGASPGIEAFLSCRTVVVHDLARDDRFPGYAAEMVATTPVRSVVSHSLRLGRTVVGVMSCYARCPDLFDEAAVERARLLADHAAVAIELAVAEDRADNLQAALQRSRSIGAAVGILVERYRLTPDDAFALLSRLSQDHNRKVADVAAQLLETGTVPGLERHVS